MAAAFDAALKQPCFRAKAARHLVDRVDYSHDQNGNLETIILARQMAFKIALKTAFGMSLISMISMEVAMNLTDFMLTGGALLTWWAVPLMLVAGFITPLPYNYWRLKALGKACH